MRGKLSDYFTVWNQNSSLFFIAGVISNMGSYLTAIAIPLAVYKMTGSVSLLALVWLWRIVISFACLPFSGVIADLYNRKNIMLVSNAMSVVADAIMFFGLLQSNVPLLLAGVCILQAGDRFFTPASTAVFPSFFEPDQLPVANSVRRALSQAISFVGPAAGGVLAAALGINWLFLLDGISFVASSMIIVLIRLDFKFSGRTSRTVRGFFDRLGEGFTEAARTPSVVLYLVVGALGAVAARLIDIIGVYITQEILGTGSQGLGYLYSAMSLGSILSFFVIPRLRLDRLNFRLYGVMELVSGLLMVTFAAARSAALAYSSLFARSGIDVVSGTMLDSEIQKVVPSNKLGRVSSIIFMSYVVGSLAGIGLSQEANRAHVIWVFSAVALVTVVVGVWIVRSYGARYDAKEA